MWIDGNTLLTFSYETICLHTQFLWIGLSVMYDLDGTEVVKKVICIQLMKAETCRLKNKSTSTPGRTQQKKKKVFANAVCTANTLKFVCHIL